MNLCIIQNIKCLWYERQLIIIDSILSFKIYCYNCEYIYKDLKLSKREWTCQYCKLKIYRDYNASLNILNEGLKQINYN